MFEPGGPTFFELAEQALSSTRKGYDLLAPKFDKTPFRTPDAILEPVADWIGPFDRGVDLCCGTGAAMAALRPFAREGLAGVDVSEGMLAVAAGNLRQADGSAPIQLVEHDVLTWDGEEAYDLAVSFGAFGHILRQDEGRFLDTVWRALRPGGRFVFVTGRNPGPAAPAWWAAKAFNAAIHARNLVIRPPFHMYYLTFLWPDIGDQLQDRGFDVTMHQGLFGQELSRVLLVEAVKPPPH